MSFPQDVKEKALVACGRCCCICHKFCGNNMEVHHIIQHADGGTDEFDNAIPLCLDCHAEVGQYNPRHPKGTKFTIGELKGHRDKWYEKVEKSNCVVQDEEYLDLDRKNYYALEEYLQREKFVKLKELDFGNGSFPLGYFDKIEFFPRLIDDPKYEYMDADIESAKVSLAESIIEFSRKSLPVLHSDDCKTVRIPPDWELTFPERFINAVETLNEASIEVWSRYSDYIRLCRRKLKIEIQ